MIGVACEAEAGADATHFTALHETGERGVNEATTMLATKTAVPLTARSEFEALHQQLAQVTTSGDVRARRDADPAQPEGGRRSRCRL